MKIDDRFFHFPPYASVCWDQVSSLEGKHLPDGQIELTLHLLNGHRITLPDLSEADTLKIFQGFQDYQETRHLLKVKIQTLPHNGLPPSSSPTSPLAQIQGLSLASHNLEQFARALKHNPQMRDLPTLPEQTLARIAHAARLMFNSEEGELLPQPHPGCHCVYCQISRAIQAGMEQASLEIDDDELRLSRWHIEPLNQDHYVVASTSDPDHRHEVRLKPQISCSCQEPGCDHIAAVLRT